MQVRFYGTRGSLPVPGRQTVRYGGNTSCTAVRSDSGTLVVLDMGTGAYPLGQELMALPRPIKGHVLISHTHWDHIQGLPFFAPFFVPGNQWEIYAPRGIGSSIRETLSGQMQYTYFPLELEQLGASISYHDIVEGTLQLGDIAVETQYLNHPAMTLGYRLTADGVTVVHALDHEPYSASLASGTGTLDGPDLRHAQFLENADLVIHDAQYLADEFSAKVGWGHSTVEYARQVASTAGVKRLALAHHDPARSDDAVDAIVARYQQPDGSMELFAAAEGMTLDLAPVPGAIGAQRLAEGSDTAIVQPALAQRSVLIAGESSAVAERLAEIARMDRVQVLRCRLAELPETLARQSPSLVLAMAGSDEAELTKALGRASEHAAVLGTPIVLIGGADVGKLAKRLQATDWLAEPFTDSYARTRIRAWLLRQACRWGLPPVPPNEAQRLAALHSLNILDTPPDETLDQVVDLTADVFSAPVVALTMVDRDRQWFKAKRGLNQAETPRDESFCAHVVGDPAPLTVADTLLDPRFADNPEVVGPPHLRFYAGHPIVLGGHCIGTLCIADTRPRHFTENDSERLARLANLARQAIERRAVQR